MLPTTLSNIEANHLGFFILPNEDEIAYSKRVSEYVKQVSFNTQEHKSARDIVNTLYDIDPQWVPITYSKKGLYPWEAACSWTDVIPSVQLHPYFEKNTKLFGFYDKDEILAHEYVHACRSHLDSNAYEELFAYLVSLETAKGGMRLFSFIRVFLGPLFSSPGEVLAFILLSLVTSVFAFFCLFVEESSYLLCSIFFLTAFAFLSMAAFWTSRLFIRLWRWVRCYKTFEKNNLEALKLMVRLSDAEITKLGGMSDESFLLWRDEARHEFRWGFLLARYGLWKKR